MLARGVDRRAGALLGREIGRRPAGQGELGVLGLVAGRGAVPVLGAHHAVGVDQDGAERLVTGVERLPGQLDAAPQMPQIGLVHGEMIYPGPAS